MGTSVAMIERHYGQTNVLIGIEHETAKRKKPPRADQVTEVLASADAAAQPELAQEGSVGTQINTFA